MANFVPMLLMNSQLKKGEIRDFIDSISDKVSKDMALAEYYYYTGRHTQSVAITSEYIKSDDFYVKASAWLLYLFSNLPLNRQEETKAGLNFIYSLLNSKRPEAKNPSEQALLIMIANAGNILFHLDIQGMPPVNDYLRFLPPGLRVFGSYLMAHKAYLKGEYEKGLGIVETVLSFEGETYLIPTIFIYLSGAMNAMSLNRVEKGKEYFLKAYDLAKADELLEPIGEHHGLLQGLIEICLKKSEKSYYERIIEITYQFSYGWRRVHNPIANENVADTLTTTEFTIAMLANRGWTNNEIADYMEMNVNTVKSHITGIFNKLGINSRKELNEYMLR